MQASSDDCNPEECFQPSCNDVFERVRLSPSIRHGSIVEWQIDPRFADPEPHTFQLQWGYTGLSVADDWEDVGLPADDVFSLTDTIQRAYGHVQRTHYRVKLTTSLGEYVSRPQNCWGNLTPREWRLALNRERIWRLQFERTLRGQRGFLLKHKIHGEVATADMRILDWMTGEVIDAQNPETIGGEFVGEFGSFYAPICADVDLSNMGRAEDTDLSKGTTNKKISFKGTMLAVPQVDTGDVFVTASNDHRYHVFEIDNLEEINGVGIVINASFKLLPFSHVVYSIPVGNQV